VSTVRTLGNIALGSVPWVPWEGAHGLDTLTPARLTELVAGEAPGAEVMDLATKRHRQTTDRASLTLTWNEAGREAGLPTQLFAKGTASLTSSRILNSTFGLCGTEVRVYRDLHADLADMTLKPYHASIGAGGRFLLLLESRDPEDTYFFHMKETGTIEHARAIVTQLAQMHAKFHESPRFETDLRWVTRYSRRPGQAISPLILKAAEKAFNKKYDVPADVRELTHLHVHNGREFARAWEALPSTLCHGDTHIGNTFRSTDGTSGLFDWQEVHRMNGLREIAYFIASAFEPDDRQAYEHELLYLYLQTLAASGTVPDVPTHQEAFDTYRLMMLDAWRSVWASVALMSVQDDGMAQNLIKRHCGHLMDLDVLQVVKAAL
jgi:hypothetical protein